MTFRFHPEALEDYQQATFWYAQREQKVALQFVEVVEEAIRRVVEAPTRWRVIEEIYAGVSPTFFRTRFSTQSKRTSY